MRTRLLALLPLAGCNQIFGLDAVTLVDAGPDQLIPDGPQPTATLQIITPELGAFSTPTRQPAFAPMVPAPLVEVGDIGGALEQATYTADGTVLLPYAFAGRTEPWRLVYTRPGDVPHEVHWAPAADAGHFVELQLTPDSRAELPASSTLVLRPNLGGVPHPGPIDAPRVFTTGAWTETRMPVREPSPDFHTVRVALNDVGTVAQAGPKRAPSAEDYAVLISYGPAGQTGGIFNCQAAQSFASFQVDVAGGASTDPTPPEWTAGTSAPVVVDFPQNPQALLATVYPGATVLRKRMTGVGPAGGIPMIARATSFYLLPQPVGISLLECNEPGELNTNTVAFSTPVDPALPTTTATTFYLVASIDGVTGTVGIGTVSANAQLGQGAQTHTFETVIPADPTIDGVNVQIATSGPNASTITLPAIGETVSLSFTPQPSTNTASFYTATLHRIEGNALVRVRDFTFTTVPLEMDGDLFAPGETYTVELRAYRGAAQAGAGDFRTWTDAQGMARIYTQSFTR